MTIEINGMAHVMLTVSRFQAARGVYGQVTAYSTGLVVGRRSACFCLASG